MSAVLGVVGEPPQDGACPTKICTKCKIEKASIVAAAKYVESDGV